MGLAPCSHEPPGRICRATSDVRSTPRTDLDQHSLDGTHGSHMLHRGVSASPCFRRSRYWIECWDYSPDPSAGQVRRITPASLHRTGQARLHASGSTGLALAGDEVRPLSPIGEIRFTGLPAHSNYATTPLSALAYSHEPVRSFSDYNREEAEWTGKIFGGTRGKLNNPSSFTAG